MSMKPIRFRGVLMSGHKGSAFETPFDPGREWGREQVRLWAGRRGYPVQGQLNGVAFRSAIVSRMRCFFSVFRQATWWRHYSVQLVTFSKKVLASSFLVASSTM